MNALQKHRYRAGPARQCGLTLVEIMAAMAIALFLLGGLFTIVQNTKKTFIAQNQMAQLLDSERLAMTLIGDVIQAGGYYPDPTLNTAAATLPAIGVFVNPGQGIYGIAGGLNGGDMITVRFATVNNDGIINCTGTSNTTGLPQIYSSQFWVDPLGNLACKLNGGASTPLVAGVNQLLIMYGVKTNFAVNNGAVDSYLKASEMSAANWNNVIAVQVRLTFNNPMAGKPGQPATIVFQRIVDVMAQTGVRT